MELLPVPLVELSVPLVLGEAEGEVEELEDESVPEGDGVLDELLEPVVPVEDPLEDPVEPIPLEVLEGLEDEEGGVVVVELLLVDLRSHAARPSAVAIARGIINAFMVAPGVGGAGFKMGLQGRKFRALIHRNSAVQPRVSRAFRHVVQCVLFGASAACGAQEVSVPTLDPATPFLPASIVRPEGGGRDGQPLSYPAIVLLHDCSGLGPMSSGAPRRWARELAARGYVVILPDSFTPRGHAGGICTVPPLQRHAGVVPDSRAADARAALAYLRTLSYVDPQRIGVMGGSHGGASTLATMVSSGGQSFRAGLALYPACAVNYGSWRADLTGVYAPQGAVAILIGELDDWTPADRCRKLVESAQAGPHPVSIKVYPGAHHSFDSSNPVRFVAARINQHAPGRRGATTGGNSAAWADSIEEVTRFFGGHLAATK